MNPTLSGRTGRLWYWTLDPKDDEVRVGQITEISLDLIAGGGAIRLGQVNTTLVEPRAPRYGVRSQPRLRAAFDLTCPDEDVTVEAFVILPDVSRFLQDPASFSGTTIPLRWISVECTRWLRDSPKPCILS